MILRRSLEAVAERMRFLQKQWNALASECGTFHSSFGNSFRPSESHIGHGIGVPWHPCACTLNRSKSRVLWPTLPEKKESGSRNCSKS